MFDVLADIGLTGLMQFTHLFRLEIPRNKNSGVNSIHLSRKIARR